MNLAKTLYALSVAVAASAALGSAHGQDALIGSWVLDPAKTAAPPGASPTSGTLEITKAGDKYSSVSEVAAGGTTGRSEITYAVDGKDYAVTVMPAQPGVSLTQAIERVSETVYKSSVKLNGQPLATALTEISGDGGTLTQTTTGIGQFAALSSTVVFRRK